tara:strand:- start:32458 stop:33765 length:1308 start_codon:yes stop_codon:yes gene_type:complete
MNNFETFSIKPVPKINLKLNIPGDKSISHRSIILNSISNGKAKVEGIVSGEDCLSTIRIAQQLGCKIETKISDDGSSLESIVHGVGLDGFKKPKKILDAGNSGTTTRLFAGLLVGRKFRSEITGDHSLLKRPMGRIINPLTQMGGKIYSKKNNNKLPIIFDGGNLKGITYTMPIASAQLKSALLLAGIRAEGKSIINQPEISRNHTELILNSMGASIKISEKELDITPTDKIYPVDIKVPGDISSAAFWIIAGLCHPNSNILLENIGINKTRSGILKVLRLMGGNIEISNLKNISGEDVADIFVKSSNLNSTIIDGDIIPLLIDEIPILAVAAAMAEGTTVIKDAKELKYKESNRIEATTNWLKNAGINCEATDDGMIIEGNGRILGGEYHSMGDHRIAMSIGIAGLFSESPVTVIDSKSVEISYPNFWKHISKV